MPVLDIVVLWLRPSVPTSPIVLDPEGLTRGLSLRHLFDEQNSSLQRLAHVQRADGDEDAGEGVEDVEDADEFEILTVVLVNVGEAVPFPPLLPVATSVHERSDSSESSSRASSSA